MLIGAGLLGLAAIAIAPRLYGGGGDEGVDILPASGGLTTGGAADGPRVGFVTIHGENLDLDTGDEPIASGLLVGSHSLSDVFLGLPGTEPSEGSTALDLMTKGKRKLAFSELLEVGGAGPVPSLHFNGRFQIEDIDPLDGEQLELVGFKRKPSVLSVMVGHRSTHDGGVRQSFTSVDIFTFQNVPSGSVDLVAFRAAASAALAGSGYDISLTLYARARRGYDEVVVSWNVDDARAIYDVDVRLR
jgi:hypothetical protein